MSLISNSMWQPDHPQTFDPAQAAKFVPSGGYITENLEVTPMSFLCVFPDYNSKIINIITHFIGFNSYASMCKLLSFAQLTHILMT